MSFWTKVFSWLRRTKILEIPVFFELDYINGQHEIRIYQDIEGEKIQITNVQELMKHGFVWEGEKEKHIISQSDFETLLAIKALNPKIGEDGVIRSDVYPSILKYLRATSTLDESDSSKSIKVLDEPLQKRAEVLYQPDKGISVKAGFQIPDGDELIFKSSLESTIDPEYVKVGDTFVLLPTVDNKQVEDLLDREQFTVDPDDVPYFFKRDLIFIKSNFNAVLTGEINRIEIFDQELVPLIKIELGEKGWLEFVVEYQIGEYVIPHDLFKKSNKGFLKLDEFSWVEFNRNQIDLIEKQLNSLDVERLDEGFRTDVTQYLSLEEFISQIGGVKEVSKEYQQFLDDLTDFKYDETFHLPAETESILKENGIFLRPYQRAGIHWLDWLYSHNLHGILADDMGLGKTIQTIVALKLLHNKEGNNNHILIICPKSVTRHWLKEIKRVWPEPRVFIHLGQDRRHWLFKRSGTRIFITTYATAANDIDYLNSIPFFALVLDEGTWIKNPQTKRAQAVKQINALHRFVLSGTPIENRPAELWSIFDFLMKGHLGSYGGFISKFERPIIEGNIEASEYLAKRIRPFILRRLKEDVADDLPEKIVMEEWCELTKEQKALYGQIQDINVSPIRNALLRGEHVSVATSILPIITKLKQVCDHPALITGINRPLEERSEKFDLICEKITEIIEKSEQAVLFSHFLGTLDLFQDYLQIKNVDYIRIDGSTTNRQTLIDRFNETGIPMALLSLRAAGHGINMTAANHVIHVDRWWNPAVEDQATDRVHRIGQFKTVYVHHVLTEGTLEERIDKLIEKKRGISDSVIGAAITGPMQWTREELLEILEPLKI